MYEYRTLANGIRVVAERIPHLRSISIGVWVANGSRNERAEENGMSHFIEHMVFKGTMQRTAWDIAHAIDSVGGQLNAYTTREYTCFYTKTLDTHAGLALDILSDMLFCPRFDREDMELERNVIFEEIGMYEDSPEDVVYDLAAETVWRDKPLGRSILGTRETLLSVTPERMRAYMKKHYTAGTVVLSVSGNYTEELFILLEKYFGTRDISQEKIEPETVHYTAGRSVKRKDIEQAHLVGAFEGIDVMDESVYSLLVFNNVFGSGMSSRLFQNIREKLGLVYSIDAGHSAYIGTGMFEIYAGMKPENLSRVCELIGKEVRRIRREKLTAEQVRTAKEQLKGNYILSNENAGARMMAAGRAMILGKKIYAPEEALAKIDAVTVDSTAEIIDRVLRPETFATAVVGPVDGDFCWEL